MEYIETPGKKYTKTTKINIKTGDEMKTLKQNTDLQAKLATLNNEIKKHRLENRVIKLQIRQAKLNDKIDKLK